MLWGETATQRLQGAKSSFLPHYFLVFRFAELVFNRRSLKQDMTASEGLRGKVLMFKTDAAYSSSLKQAEADGSPRFALPGIAAIAD